MMKKKGVVPRPGDDPRERLCAGGCEGLCPSSSQDVTDTLSLVRVMGIEPTRLMAPVFETGLFTNYNTLGSEVRFAA